MENYEVKPAFYSFSSTGQVLRHPHAIRGWHDQVPELGPVHTDAASRQHMHGKIVHSRQKQGFAYKFLASSYDFPLCVKFCQREKVACVEK
jgi:hypothetical protein